MDNVSKTDLQCDVMEVFLELGHKAEAKLLGWFVPLTEERMQKIINRQERLRNPEILHQIFNYFGKAMEVSIDFMDDFLRKIADLYGKLRFLWV